jgi:hypothetical protein
MIKRDDVMLGYKLLYAVNFAKRGQQVICYQCGRVAFQATSSVRTTAENNAVGNR